MLLVLFAAFSILKSSRDIVGDKYVLFSNLRSQTQAKNIQECHLFLPWLLAIGAAS